MIDGLKKTAGKKRWRSYVAAALLLVVVLAVSGCHTLTFYGQALKGQYRILAHEESIRNLLAARQTPAALRARLELLERLREFAAQELKLPVDNHYRNYVDLHRPYVVWNVEAAPEFSMQPKTWWYPLLGSLAYRGYFSHAGATNYAGYLRRRGYDVSVGGVEAYSTLGWFKDPVLNTFLFEPDAELAEILFHELGHQRVFARGDTDFNEAFATTVGEQGARRWLKARGDSAALDRYLVHLQHNLEFVRLVMATRLQLEDIYGDQRTPEGQVKATAIKRGVPPEQLREQKRQAFEAMKQQFAVLRAQSGVDSEYGAWFSHNVNNARLNSVAEYYDLVPGFEQLLAQNGGDLEKFYKAVEHLSKKPKKERHEELQRLAKQAEREKSNLKLQASGKPQETDLKGAARQEN